jgi:hypothetical protein
MSEQEFEAFRSHHTRKALEGLREHLKKNADEQNRTVNALFDNGKTKEAELLNRFVDGSYEGRPKSPIKSKPETSLWRKILKILTVGILSILVVGALIYSVKHSASLLKLKDRWI